MSQEQKAEPDTKASFKEYGAGLDLPTEEEFDKMIAAKKQTAFGRVFPIRKEECARVFFICALNGCVGFLYSIMKDFCPTITRTVLDSHSKNYLKFFGFFASVFVADIVNSLIQNLGPTRAIRTYTVCCSIGLVLYSLLVFIATKFWFYSGWGEKVLVGSGFELRGILSMMKTPLLMFNHLHLTIYYVLCETVGGILLTALMPFYITSLIPSKVYKRYLKLILLSLNIFSFGSQMVLKKAMNALNTVSMDNIHMVYILILLLASVGFIVVFAGTFILVPVLSKPIYVETKVAQKAGGATAGKGKKKGGLGLSEVFQAMMGSKVLTSICILNACYNFSNSYLSGVRDNAVEAYNSYLVSHPSEVKISGYKAGVNFLHAYFSLSEMTIVSAAGCWTLISPLSEFLFNLYGVFLFAVIQPIFGIFAAIFSIFLIANNFHLTNAAKTIWLMFDVSRFGILTGLHFECFVFTLFIIFTKFSKYALYDYYMENIIAEVQPDDRFKIKGIIGGFCSKGSQLLYSILVFLFEGIGLGTSARYTSLVSGLLSAFFCLGGVFGAIYLHTVYNRAIRQKTFIEDSPFGGGNGSRK